jgi:hypothetical protein
MLEQVAVGQLAKAYYAPESLEMLYFRVSSRPDLKRIIEEMLAE